jgi:hypothetical protein
VEVHPQGWHDTRKWKGLPLYEVHWVRILPVELSLQHINVQQGIRLGLVHTHPTLFTFILIQTLNFISDD